MPNSYFRFKQFIVHQELAAMKVTTDACLFGAWIAAQSCMRDQSVNTILDIGAGTGLLSLMVAQKTNAEINAVEIDQDAAVQAKKNFAESPWHERLKVVHQDIHEFSASRSYDAIISNPPFYENDLTGSNTKKNIAHHDAGLLLQDLIRIISLNLTPGKGNFFLLLPEKRLDEVLAMFRQHGLSVSTVCKVRQSVNHGFFRVMIHGINHDHEETSNTEELAIRNGDNQYTETFERLLSDYYLYL